MYKITQDMHFRLSLIQYAEKYGVIKAAIKYKTNRQYIYRWEKGAFQKTSSSPQPAYTGRNKAYLRYTQTQS